MKDILVGRLSTALFVPKQIFTLMLVMNKQPRDFKTMITKNFLIINKEHIYAAMMVFLADPKCVGCLEG
jgi:hypothetical protein